MKRSLMITSLALAMVAAAGTASAAIPSADGVISACKSKDGAIKLIDTEAGQACKVGQQLVEWNQEGPQGPAGQGGGVAGHQIVYAATPVNDSYDKTEWAFCPSGKKAIGGGAGVYGAELDGGGQVIVHGVGLVQNHPFNDYGWGARAEELVPTATPWRLSVWVICADAS